MFVISPWSKGGWVNSQLFDHTSLIRFLEARFAREFDGLIETNITPWRRAVVGDLTSAFDFSKPEAWRKLKLPGTAAYVPTDFERHPDEEPVPPAHQALPTQEPGVRPARALPYSLEMHGGLDDEGTFTAEFRNRGRATGVFHVRSGDPADAPRTYTVEPRKRVSDNWPVAGANYDFSVFGPNGFFRSFRGASGPDLTAIDARVTYDEDGRGLVLELENRTGRRVEANIWDAYSSKATRMTLDPAESASRHWSVRRVWRWYDLTVTVDGDPAFEYRFAGHIENGEDSISDPAMGGLV
jgi:phospholipase C